MKTALAALMFCFVVGLIWGPWLIERLRELKFGKQIRLEGQEHHLAKAGTPTMGGWHFVLTAILGMALFARDGRVLVPLALGMVLFGLFGSIDDYANINSREGLGLHVHTQIAVQLALSILVGVAVYGLEGFDHVQVPFLGTRVLGLAMVPFAALVVFATSTAANILDGLDGLAAGCVAIALVAYLAIALRGGNLALAAAAAAFIGALMAFLWFNVNPARVFMGGGALPLGAGLGTIALLSGEALILPIVAAPLVIALGSSVLQTTYYKLSGGKRIFKRAPFQHHLELIGWPEQQIVFRAWLFAGLCAVLGLVLAEL